MANITKYTPGAFGDISPRTAAFVVKELLQRAMPYLVFEKFGQTKPLDKNSTQSMKFRRYFLKTTFSDGYNPAEYLNSGNFDPSTHVLTEGVTPDGSFLNSEDLSVSLAQYGDKVTITDVIMDTHEDNILKEAIAILGEQAALMLEKIRFRSSSLVHNVFRAGATNTLVANRNEVVGTLSLDLQRKIVRGLKRNLARPITSIVKSTASYGTEPIAPAYVPCVTLTLSLLSVKSLALCLLKSTAIVLLGRLKLVRLKMCVTSTSTVISAWLTLVGRWFDDFHLWH
jgi:N4-gp56 family major capsid protein